MWGPAGGEVEVLKGFLTKGPSWRVFSIHVSRDSKSLGPWCLTASSFGLNSFNLCVTQLCYYGHSYMQARESGRLLDHFLIFCQSFFRPCCWNPTYKFHVRRALTSFSLSITNQNNLIFYEMFLVFSIRVTYLAFFNLDTSLLITGTLNNFNWCWPLS